MEAKRCLDSQGRSTWEGLRSWIPSSGATTLKRYNQIWGCTKCAPRSYLNSVGTSEGRNARKAPQQHVQRGGSHLDIRTKQEKRLRMLQEID